MGERATTPDLERLYAQYGHAIYRRCRYFLHHDADARDAMHDIFVKLCTNYTTFRGEASPLTWIVRVTTNHCLNVLRARRATWPERYATAAQVAAATRPQEQGRHERQELIRLVLAKVERPLQEAAVYYFVDEMTQQDAAAAAGCSVPTLRKRLRAFIRVARRVLARLDKEWTFGEMPI